MTQAAGTSASASAALVVLAASPGLSVTELGRRVGLSQPAAARMVDSMESARLVDRGPGPGRQVSVQPTPAGRDAAARLLHARGQPLDNLLAALGPDEQGTLAGLLAKLLVRLYDQDRNSEHLCRLCDRTSCTANTTCPVGQAERDQDR